MARGPWSVCLSCQSNERAFIERDVIHHLQQGFSLTLFQSLAFAAGYDPVAGPGSSCSTESSSGQCVLPWAGGTKNVSSVVLVASGVSFAVRMHSSSLKKPEN